MEGECGTIENARLFRNVREVKEFGSVVVPTSVIALNVPDDIERQITIDSVREIADDETIPEFKPDRFTGVYFMGNIEQSTRKNSRRVAAPHSERIGFIDYTDAEHEAIRRFVLDNASERPSRFSFGRLALYGINAVAVGFLSFILYRKLRYA